MELLWWQSSLLMAFIECWMILRQSCRTERLTEQLHMVTFCLMKFFMADLWEIYLSLSSANLSVFYFEVSFLFFLSFFIFFITILPISICNDRLNLLSIHVITNGWEKVSVGSCIQNFGMTDIIWVFTKHKPFLSSTIVPHVHCVNYQPLVFACLG